jgi:2-alkyl-3-oxoalkanoate reductase
MKILVTGLGGFLGGAIGERLLARGDELSTVSRRPLPEWEARGVRVVLGPLEDRRCVIEAARGCEQVFHVAAKAGIWGDYSDYYASNVLATENVLEACWACQCGSLIYTSTPSVTFDGHDAAGVDESKPYPESFLNFYSETKAIAEQKVLAANGRAGLATVALRPHLIWGPGDPHLLPRLVRAADAGRLRRIGNGDNLVDTTYIENAVDAHLAAAAGLTPESAQAGKAYFISNGQPVSLWSWMDQLLLGLGRPPVRGQLSVGSARLLGGMLEWFYRTARLPGEPPLTHFTASQLGTHHYYNISAAQRDFGYQPRVSFSEGMQQVMSYFGPRLQR